MAGIAGYIGLRNALPIIISLMKHMEYRGYDSCGIGVVDNGINVYKDAVRVASLEETLPNLNGVIGIGHTRWATHGEPSKINAHPHLDCTGKIAVIHNGMIANFQELRQKLGAEGHNFASETDSEIIPHLIEKYYNGNLEKAIELSLGDIEGSYAIVVMMESESQLVAARKDSPLVIGIGNGENYITSDVVAILDYSDRVIYLEDGDIAVVTEDSIKISRGGIEADRKEQRILWSRVDAQKTDYKHFMLKEIHDQPKVISDVLSGQLLSKPPYVSLGEFPFSIEVVRSINRIILVGSGVSYHIALIGSQMMEAFAAVPTQAEVSSEFTYREPLLDPHTLVIALSQSGETADTIAALSQSKNRGAMTLALCCVLGSTASRIANGVMIAKSGPELAVAGTKSFTTMLTLLYLIAIHLGLVRGVIGSERARVLATELQQVPQFVEQILNQEEKYKTIVERFQGYHNFLYMGRGPNYPIAMEGELLLKEVAYLQAEALPAGEVVHGTIAVVGSDTLTIAIVPKDNLYRKMMGNIQMVKARQATVIALGTEGDLELSSQVDHVLYIPKVSYFVNPVLSVIPLQLMAYHVAHIHGCPIDMPRNLAKSVSVE